MRCQTSPWRTNELLWSFRRQKFPWKGSGNRWECQRQCWGEFWAMPRKICPALWRSGSRVLAKRKSSALKLMQHAACSITCPWTVHMFRTPNTPKRFPLYPCLSERLKDDILKHLFPSVNPGMTLKCTPLSSPWEDWVPAMHIIASLAKSTQGQDSTWAFTHHVSIASILRQILWSIIPMQQSSHIFSYSCDAIQNSFNGSQSLF